MKTIITAALLTASTIASAQFITGNQLLDRMNAETSNTRMYALGYVIGVVDSMNGYAFCLPSAATAGQINDMMRNYLNNTPAERHLPADVVIVQALGGAFPCSKKGSGT